MQHNHHPSISQYNRGFTLIEILVVVVIISFMTGLVVVNFSAGGEDDLAEEEIIRLQQLLRFAHEQSVIRSQEYGVRFYKTGYRFMKLNEDDDDNKIWEDVNDKLLRSRSLPEPLELDLYIEQLPVELVDSQDDDPEIEVDEPNKLETAASNDPSNIGLRTQKTEQEKIKPQVFLFSSSELEPPFELRIRIPGTRIEQNIEGLPQGEYERVIADE